MCPTPCTPVTPHSRVLLRNRQNFMGTCRTVTTPDRQPAVKAQPSVGPVHGGTTEAGGEGGAADIEVEDHAAGAQGEQAVEVEEGAVGGP